MQDMKREEELDNINNNDNNNEPVEEDDKANETENNPFKKGYNELNIKAGDDTRKVMNIETQHYIPIKFALLKYYEKDDVKDIDMYEYRRKKIIQKYDKFLEIHKKKNYYVCSREKLEIIDFNKHKAVEDYWSNMHM